MKTSELVKILKRNGCYLQRHGSSHDIWVSKVTGRRFSVPRHPGGEMPKGTAERILKDAGVKGGY